MKKIIGIIFLLALLFPVSAYAAGPCGDFEYAELKDMDQESYVKEYCAARKTGKLYAELSMFGGRRQDKISFESCHEMLEKMERIYTKRFNVTAEEMRGLCK